MSCLLQIYLKRSKLYYFTVIIFFMFLSYCFKCIYNLIIHSTEEICSALAPAPDINLASTNLEFKKSFVWGLQSFKFFSMFYLFRWSRLQISAPAPHKKLRLQGNPGAANCFLEYIFYEHPTLKVCSVR